MSGKPMILISEVANNTHSSVSPSTTETSYLDGSLSEVTMMGNLEHSTRLKQDVTREARPPSQAMINMLPDEALLETFHFYKDSPISRVLYTWSWITLIHVCRRWRHIIFGSPRRLDLQLVYSCRTPRRLLDIWPPFPIVVNSLVGEIIDEGRLENTMAVLERRDRISRIDIYIHDTINGSAALEALMAAMHQSFPFLVACILTSAIKSVSMPVLEVLPETFLGGSAPNLEQLQLWGIPFPTLPTFIMSSTQIQVLYLNDIPDSGYISPGSMATCLAALPNLTDLSIGFRSPLSRPIGIRPRPLTRTVLPSLVAYSFTGVSEYFEDFVAQIHAPTLRRLTLLFFMDLIFDLPQLRNFIGLTQRAKQATMEFTTWLVNIVLWSQCHFELGIKCERLDWQLSSMTQIFSQQLPFLSHVEHFEILDDLLLVRGNGWEDNSDMDPSQWLELFRLLISVESLFVTENMVNRVAASLKELTGEMAMEVLPALRNLLLEGLQPSGPVQDDVKSFVTARRPTNHPILVQRWERPHPFIPPANLAELDVQSQPEA